MTINVFWLLMWSIWYQYKPTDLISHIIRLALICLSAYHFIEYK